MRTGIWLSTLAALLVVPTFAQDATVTFYAPGSITKTALKEMFTFKGDAAFMGSIFDGHQRLVGLAPNHFVTFRFPAGAHSFSAGTGSKHGDKDSQLPMVLTGGEHYCIRANANYKSTTALIGVTFTKSTLEEVPCDQMNQESPDAKPAAIKHVDKGVQNLIDSPMLSQSAIGVFEGHQDVGTVLHPGNVEYDATKQTYAISGSGENMWFTSDAFQFAWKRVSGDVMLTSDISFVGTGGNPHRKAVLIIRQSLDADSPYADVALHGVGLTSLQFRLEKGATTHEVEASESMPRRLRILKRGDYIYMVLGDDLTLHPSGASIKLPLRGDFYVGIGVCSHDKDAVEKAVFSNVSLKPLPASTAEPVLYSTLETVPVASTDRRVSYVAKGRFEAPNWTRDGGAFIFNRDGGIYRLAVSGGEPGAIDTGFAKRCNNDHGISPDGKLLAISNSSSGQSQVYTLPVDGGSPQKITAKSPSYWHGWSPDGKTLVFTGQRDGEFDIYAIPATGGEETRLTTAKGLDDGPEYSPDGRYIYYNSERTGHMQIWRMAPDGAQQEQVTFDDTNDWFPHISPDGKWMVFLAYEKDVKGHPPDKDVTLRLMSLADVKVSVLATLFGGQGTINVPSWSPDSLKLAFVSYQMLPEEALSAN